MKINKFILLTLLVGLAVSARAQLSLDDINKTIKPLKADITVPGPEIVTVLDTLMGKGYVLVPVSLSQNPKAVTYENAVDTIRKQIIEISSTPGKDKGTMSFTVKVVTRDITEFNGWLKTANSYPTFIIDPTKVSDYSHRIFVSTLAAGENQQYDFSTKIIVDPKRLKHIYLYQIVYTRTFVGP